MRESKVFDEYDVSGAMLESENPVIAWISNTTYEMLKEQGIQPYRKCYDGDEYFGKNFKITIECFESKEELKQNQQMTDRII